MTPNMLETERPRTALITGAASGIGRATAVSFAAAGWTLVLIDTSSDLAELAATLRGEGTTAHTIIGSVADPLTWESAVAIAEGLPPLEAFVSNAYTVELKPLGELERHAWDTQIEVNLTATYLGLHALLPALRAARASLVFVSSVHARVGLPHRPAYAASKGALVSLAQQLAVEYGADLRVNTVLPGPVITAAWDDLGPAERARSATATALGRLGDPSEVAEVIHFLASPAASFITGASIPVDGGWLVKKDSA